MTTPTPAQSQQPEQAPETPTREPSIRRLRFSVKDYYRLAEAGILKPDVRSELIEGEIYLICPIDSRHAACVDVLNACLSSRIGPRAIVRIQGPIHLGDYSEPKPDMMLLRPRPDFYKANHPGPADVLLVVEVMDASAEYDRKVKLPLYARSKVAEVCLVDLPNERIEVHRRPLGDIYTEIRIAPRGQIFATEAFPDLELAADAILG